ncbi:hypothetical protein [Streptomyces sp. NPDC056061]|uniref:hypothetical protein n=1 Tax=Streptomyces sp. NPDC056061 TaxID=3345700 RepID=UPI0035DB1E3F
MTADPTNRLFARIDSMREEGVAMLAEAVSIGHDRLRRRWRLAAPERAHGNLDTVAALEQQT